MDKTDEEMAALVDTIDVPVSATTDIRRLRDWLREELDYKAPGTAEGLEKWWRGVETRYGALPELGLGLERYVHNAGKINQYTEVSFRDLTTGKFVGYETARSMIGEWWRR
ncbi:MAG: hypothetical protein KKD77_22705 [Gammaproteobacteria bacterium]|nr:hypothetical protein [Gammaproteobacteria bacterium]